MSLSAAKSCATAAGVYCGFGLQLPLVPTVVGLIAVGIVRTLAWERKRSFLWNMMVALLAMLAALVTIEGHEGMSNFKAFWIGVGYGGLGVGIVKMGTDVLGGTIKERVSGALKTLFGIKDTTP